MVELEIIDGALGDELLYWQTLVQQDKQSTSLDPGDYEGTYLYRLAQAYAGHFPIIHVLAFNIIDGHDTELHQDIGEYVVLFYPFDCPTAPLHVSLDHVDEQFIAVKENRLIALDCSKYAHRQMIPTDGTVRHSIAFKFDAK